MIFYTKRRESTWFPRHYYRTSLYVLQLNMYMIHVYIISLTCARNGRNMERTHAPCTHTRVHIRNFLRRAWKGQRILTLMSREVDLDITFFRARNRIISRNGLLVCFAAREKRSYRPLCTRNYVRVLQRHVSIIYTTRIRMVFRIFTYSWFTFR